MKKLQNGRSMIEMLGVLAIIGVLSVGGIAGYTQAMKKYRANEITNTISMAAVMCQTGQTTAAAALSNELVTVSCNNESVSVSGINASSVDINSVNTNLRRFATDQNLDCSSSCTFTLS